MSAAPNNFQILPLALTEVKLITPKRHGDSRGFVAETFQEKHLRECGIACRFVQENHSMSAKAGTVRGLHFQTPPHAQAKLVRVLRGRIFDVALDLRRDSPTYGRHAAAELTAESMSMMFIPAGFAHGFCTLEDNTEILYKMSDFYAPATEGGVIWSDPDLQIAWPVMSDNAILSGKDLVLPRFRDLPETFTMKDSIVSS